MLFGEGNGAEFRPQKQQKKKHCKCKHMPSLGQNFLITVNLVLVRTAKNNYFSLCTNY